LAVQIADEYRQNAAERIPREHPYGNLIKRQFRSGPDRERHRAGAGRSKQERAEPVDEIMPEGVRKNIRNSRQRATDFLYYWLRTGHCTSSDFVRMLIANLSEVAKCHSQLLNPAL